MHSTDKPKVLVVEDMAKWHDLISKFLADDYILYPAWTLDEAMDLLNRHFFHVALVDLKLDEHDPDNWLGTKVVEQISKSTHGTRCIVFTSYQTPTNVREALLKYKAFDTVDKAKEGSDTMHMRGLVARARNEAQSIHTGRIEKELGISDLIPINLCERETLIEVLHVKTLDKLQLLLQQVFRDLCPVKINPKAFDVHSDEGFIQAVYWSKAIGIPLLVIIGSEKVVAEHRLSEIVQGQAHLSVVRKHTQHIEPPLVCVIYELKDADIERFVDLPLRPTSESTFGV